MEYIYKITYMGDWNGKGVFGTMEIESPKKFMKREDIYELTKELIAEKELNSAIILRCDFIKESEEMR